MDTILITGGTGFFGKSILSFIKNQYFNDYNFIILSRNPEKFLNNYIQFKNIKNVTYIYGDICTFEYNNYNIDYIIHAATPVENKVTDNEMQTTIINGTKHVLEFAKKCKKLKKILYISSGAVYGNNSTNVLIKQDIICNPITTYGKSKLIAENMCFNSNIPVNIVRCFAFLGKYLAKDKQFAIGNFINNCLHNEDIIIKGNGKTYRSYMYADDLVQWLFKILFYGKINEIYNIGSDEYISIKDLALFVKNVLNSNSEIIIQNLIQQTVTNFYIPDIFKCKNELNLKLNIDLKNAILKSI